MASADDEASKLKGVRLRRQRHAMSCTILMIFDFHAIHFSFGTLRSAPAFMHLARS